jgi:hypothetical protein
LKDYDTITKILKGVKMIERIQLCSVKGFEDFCEYYYVCRNDAYCWVVSLGRGERILKSIPSTRGYLRYCFITKSKTQKQFSEHRLFMIVFVPNPHLYTQVNHIDGIKTNNLLSNLEWCNQFQNMQHALRTGLIKTKNTKKMVL